jgi:hypothetical protein
MDASSGDPNAYRDPKSVASIGKNLQAMTDQAAADTLYDTKKEGFSSGFRETPKERLIKHLSGVLMLSGFLLILYSLRE